jgi:hypothetical protein
VHASFIKLITRSSHSHNVPLWYCRIDSSHVIIIHHSTATAWSYATLRGTQGRWQSASCLILIIHEKKHKNRLARLDNSDLSLHYSPRFTKGMRSLKFIRSVKIRYITIHFPRILKQYLEMWWPEIGLTYSGLQEYGRNVYIGLPIYMGSGIA